MELTAAVDHQQHRLTHDAFTVAITSGTGCYRALRQQVLPASLITAPGKRCALCYVDVGMPKPRARRRSTRPWL